MAPNFSQKKKPSVHQCAPPEVKNQEILIDNQGILVQNDDPCYPEPIEHICLPNNVYRNRHAEKHSDVSKAKILWELGERYFAKGKLVKAEGAFKKVICLYANLYCPNDPKMAHAHFGLGSVYLSMSREENEHNYGPNVEDHNLAHAEIHLDRAVAIMWKGKAKTSEDFVLLTHSLQKIGIVYWRQGNFEEADKHLTWTIDMMKKLYGENTDDEGEMNKILGTLYKDKGRFREAEEFYKKAYDIKKLHYDEKHKEVKQLLYVLGVVCEEQGKYQKANKYHNKIRKINGRLDECDHCMAKLMQPNIVEKL